MTRSARPRVVKFRTRLSSAVAAAVGLTVALAALASYVTVRHQLYAQVDSTLVSEAAGAFGPGPGHGAFVNLRQEGNLLRRVGGAGFVQLITAQGSVEFSSASDNGGPPLPVTSAQAAVAGVGPGPAVYRIDTVRYEGSPYRVITEGGGLVDVTGAPVAIQIARPLSEIQHTLSYLGLILWLVALGGIAAAIVLGYLIGKAMLKPVERLTAAAEHVAATQDLEATIAEEGDDELRRLARSFNAMLAALASSRQAQAQLISDAGHELRTPLTSLRTNIEVLMRVKDLPEQDRQELSADVSAQLEELTTLVGDLVELAREDEKQAEPVEVRLDAVVERALERARRRAGGVEFDVQLTPGLVRAQPALLERAVLNVLDNATKWSPPGGVVRVRLTRQDRWVLEVADQGPGISPEDLPHIFDRFYRAPTARGLPGSGLGLAIVKQVVSAAGGEVTALSAPGSGTTLVITLPVVQEEEPSPPVPSEAWPQPAPAQPVPAQPVPAPSGWPGPR